MDPDASGRDQVVADIAASTAFLEVVVGSVSQAQGFIQFSNGQETGIGGDGSAVKFQADFGVELEPERGLFAVTHRVLPRCLRYLSTTGH